MYVTRGIVEALAEDHQIKAMMTMNDNAKAGDASGRSEQMSRRNPSLQIVQWDSLPGSSQPYAHQASEVQGKVYREDLNGIGLSTTSGPA